MNDIPSAIDTLLTPFHQFGVNLGLSRIQTLLTTLGSPHDSVPIIHVAGTNGKGSVCAYLSSVLSAAGYRVGRYTSPHLVDWNERICIDGVPISTDVAIAILDRHPNAAVVALVLLRELVLLLGWVEVRVGVIQLFEQALRRLFQQLAAVEPVDVTI